MLLYKVWTESISDSDFRSLQLAHYLFAFVYKMYQSVQSVSFSSGAKKLQLCLPTKNFHLTNLKNFFFMVPNQLQRASNQVAAVDCDWKGGNAGNFWISNLELLVLTSLLNACFIDDDDFKGEKALNAAVLAVMNNDVADKPYRFKMELYPRIHLFLKILRNHELRDDRFQSRTFF